MRYNKSFIIFIDPKCRIIICWEHTNFFFTYLSIFLQKSKPFLLIIWKSQIFFCVLTLNFAVCRHKCYINTTLSQTSNESYSVNTFRSYYNCFTHIHFICLYHLNHYRYNCRNNIFFKN